MPRLTPAPGRSLRRLASLLGLLVPAGIVPAAASTQPTRPYVLAQRLRTSPAESSRSIPSEHFDLVFDPARVTEEQAGEARRLSEQAWTHCREVFHRAPDYRLRIDLTPDFQGATGFFRPGDPNARNPDERPMIGVRFSELDYLGLPAEYVLTHEIGHWFSGPLAGSGLGEGIADWAAGGYAGMPAQPWWGRALEEAGLWIDPEGLFITGEYPANPEVDAQNRTATYAESALLIRYLVDRYGWEKFQAFATEYDKARGRLDNNDYRRRLRPLPGRPGREPRSEARRDPRLPPDPAEVRGVFEKHFGQSWPTLLTAWQAWYRAQQPPAEPRERLILAFQIYGAIRNYEMWLLQQRTPPGRETQQAVRAAFTRANRSLREGRLEEARSGLAEARARVEQLRTPRLITLNSPKHPLEDSGNLRIGRRV